MANSIFKTLGGNSQGSQSNMAQALIQHIKGFQGDPCQILQSKINSGEMSQGQYNQLRGMAEAVAQKMMAVLPKR